MPIPSTGQISLNDDINATLQKSTNESNVSLEDNNKFKFATPELGSTVSGRSMSELRGQTLFQIFPTTEGTGMVGESLHMDGIESSHNSVKVLEPGLTTAPVFTNTKGTFSFWIKVHELSDASTDKRYLYASGSSASNQFVYIRLHESSNDHKLSVGINGNVYTSSALSGGIRLGTDPESDAGGVFIDKNGWYNFVVSLDSTVPQDDIKVLAYVNGIKLIWEDVGNLTDGQDLEFGTNQRINDWPFGPGVGTDSTFSNFIFVDGSALLPNEFGELNQGIWVPKGVNTPSSQSLVTTNLQLNYQFEDNANDSANSYDGTVSGATFRSNNYGIYDFDGSNDYIQFTNPISTSSNTDLTFSCWINWDTIITSSFTSLVGNISSTQWGPFMINIYGSSQGMNASFERYYSGNQLYSSSYSSVGMYQYTANTWYNLTFTYNAASNNVHFYVNGELIDYYTISVQNTGRAQTTTSALGIYDILSGNPRNAIDAQWGEVQIYSDVLTAANVLQNYNATKHKYFYGLNGWHFNFNNTDQGSIVSGSDLKLHLDAGDWDADGTDETSFSGTAWNDKSGNGYNAALTHSPAYNANNGGYFALDGSNDYITVPHNTAFNLDVDTTIEIWAYRAATTNEQTLIFKGDSSSNQWFINWNNSSGHYFYDYDTGSLTKSGTDTTPINEWYHFVLAWNATDKKAKMYINGREPNYNTAPTAGGGTTGSSNTSNLEIGRSNSVTSQPYWNGSIAQVRV